MRPCIAVAAGPAAVGVEAEEEAAAAVLGPVAAAAAVAVASLSNCYRQRPARGSCTSACCFDQPSCSAVVEAAPAAAVEVAPAAAAAEQQRRRPAARPSFRSGRWVGPAAAAGPLRAHSDRPGSGSCPQAL